MAERRSGAPVFDYLRATFAVACATGAGMVLRAHVDIADLAMIYLVAIASVAAFLGRGPSLAASALAVLAFDFFFVPPYFTFSVSQMRHFLTFGVMLVAGIAISSLSDRLRRQSIAARARERQTAALLALTKALVAARDVDAIARVAADHVRDVLAARAALLVCEGDTLVVPPEVEITDAELAAARTAVDRAEPCRAGRMTCLPLMAGEPVGVLAVELDLAATEARQVLESFVAQIALALERTRFGSEVQRAQVRAETEEMRSSLLSSVSHDLRTPIGTILGSATALVEPESRLTPAERDELLVAMRDEAARLERLVGNLLEMTRVESRSLRVKREWVPLEELVGAVLTRLEPRLAGREVNIDLPEDLPMVAIDPVLFEQVLINLIENAIKHTPAGTPIDIAARADDAAVSLDVADRGGGVPSGRSIFEKFVRRGTDQSGVGLGLAICHGIVSAHGGRIDASARDGGGALFRIALPRTEAPPDAPPENVAESLAP